MTSNTTLNDSAANINNATLISHVAQFASTASDNAHITQQQLHQRQQQLQRILTQYNSFVTALPASSSAPAPSATTAAVSTLLTQLIMNPTGISIPSTKATATATAAAAAAAAATSSAAAKEQSQQQQLQQLKHLQWQHEQQKAYVNALVDVTVQVIASIWPNSVAVHQTNDNNNKSSTKVADLNTFLHHILKHSRTTHSTLQLAIFYLFRIRSRILSLFHQPQHEQHSNSSNGVQQDVYMTCGRRMFLAALISAHKFLQDKTYKNSAWSKVSGLNVKEINHAEKVFLQLLDYRLTVKKEVYDQWMTMLQAHLMKQMKASSSSTANTTTAVPSSMLNLNGKATMDLNSHSKFNASVPTSAPTTSFAAAAAAAALPSPPMDDAHPTAAVIMRLQEEHLRQAQQSLPSPPLEEISSSRKRRNDDRFDTDRTMKRQCH